MNKGPRQTAGQMEAPPIADLTIDNITPNTITVNSQSDSRRLTYAFERLVTHLYGFARVKVGQITSGVRNKSILLSDVLGLSLLVDYMDHPKPPNSTEGSVLKPFHTHEAEAIASGDAISSDPNGEPLTSANAMVDIRETDSSGQYDVQYPDHSGPDGRAIPKTDAEGRFWFKAITPVSYPIPHDGPVGRLLTLLRRHPWTSYALQVSEDRLG
ncbi:Intradiol ring-cleavage dioxygenase [Ilyonectria destructans]|nr:Intradiol ring-cleavage dioxygenase [Ilyonectria destructans]